MNGEQIKAILWLRARLSRNQWARSGGVGALLAAVVVVGAVGLALLSFAGAILLGAFALGNESANVLHGVWLGLSAVFLFFWLIGLLTELQRSETIDVQRLMHLPVALGQIFALNYLASHFTLSLVVMVPAMLGLGLGLAVAHGPTMLLLLPLSLSFVFMVTAWTYCLRGWLATLMANPRKRRTIVVALTMFVIVVAQLPNLYFNVFNPVGRRGSHRPDTRRTEELLQRAAPLERFAPPLWLAAGASDLADGATGTALLGTLGQR